MDDPESEGRRRELRCQGLHDVLSKHGVHIPLVDLLAGHDASARWLLDTWKRGRTVSTIEQIHHIMKLAKKDSIVIPTEPAVATELEKSYSVPVLSVPPTLNPDTVPTLSGLRDLRCKVGLICNTGRAPGTFLRRLMESFGILEFFHSTIFSDEVGCGKPDRRIFITAAEKLGVAPSNIVHVGDNPEHDVQGAKRAGMKAILFEYEVPEGFRNNPRSLFALTRDSSGRTNVEPDRRIRSLRETMDFIRQVDDQ